MNCHGSYLQHIQVCIANIVTKAQKTCSAPFSCGTLPLFFPGGGLKPSPACSVYIISSMTKDVKF